MYPVSSRTGEDDLAGVGACFAKDTPPRVLAAPRSIKQVAPRELVGGVVCSARFDAQMSKQSV